MWQPKPPTKPGWYWMRRVKCSPGRRRIVPVAIREDGAILVFGYTWWMHPDRNQEWDLKQLWWDIPIEEPPK